MSPFCAPGGRILLPRGSTRPVGGPIGGAGAVGANTPLPRRRSCPGLGFLLSLTGTSAPMKGPSALGASHPRVRLSVPLLAGLGDPGVHVVPRVVALADYHAHGGSSSRGTTSPGRGVGRTRGAGNTLRWQMWSGWAVLAPPVPHLPPEVCRARSPPRASPAVSLRPPSPRRSVQEPSPRLPLLRDPRSSCRIVPTTRRARPPPRSPHVLQRSFPTTGPARSSPRPVLHGRATVPTVARPRLFPHVFPVRRSPRRGSRCRPHGPGRGTVPTVLLLGRPHGRRARSSPRSSSSAVPTAVGLPVPSPRARVVLTVSSPRGGVVRSCCVLRGPPQDLVGTPNVSTVQVRVQDRRPGQVSCEVVCCIRGHRSPRSPTRFTGGRSRPICGSGSRACGMLPAGRPATPTRSRT